MPPEADIQTRLASVRHQIEQAARRSGRVPEEITLLAVSKRQSAQAIFRAYEAGLRDFGESYVQEALEKIDALCAQLRSSREEASPTESERIRWHFIGHLQRNKAGEVVSCFDVFHALDSEKLARELEKKASQLGRTLDVFVQLNLSREPQKAGIAEAELPLLLRSLAQCPHLKPVGLMTIPKFAEDPEDNRLVYARLRALRDRMRDLEGFEEIRELSMGMSGDFEVAIEEGATIVRLGTTLFGPRT